MAELLFLTRSILNRPTEVRNCAKVEVAVQGSPSLTVLMVSGRKATTELESTFKESTLKLTASMKLSASFEPKVFSTSKFTVEEPRVHPPCRTAVRGLTHKDHSLPPDWLMGMLVS